MGLVSGHLETRRGSQGGDFHCLHQDQPLLTMDSRDHGPPPTVLTSDREQRTGGVKAIKPKNSHSFYKDIFLNQIHFIIETGQVEVKS